jgi:hypothetical protein
LHKIEGGELKMAERKSEPQSYGSQKDWLTGETGQTVNSESGDFYANGSDRRRAEDDEEVADKKVTSQPSGAKRDSYFKKRDY